MLSSIRFCRKGVFIKLLVVASVFIATCSSENKQPADAEKPAPIMIDTPTTQLSIENFEIRVLESFPVRVVIVVQGTLAKPCQKLDFTEEQQDTSFFITLTTHQETATCSSKEVSFKKVIPLNVDGLKAGVYNVDVHGSTERFELTVDNVIR